MSVILIVTLYIYRTNRILYWFNIDFQVYMKVYEAMQWEKYLLL